jgi:ATP-dependent RNA helicase DOB1
VACEISAADELLLTEMLFAGAFNELSAQHAAALLSCFVAEDKADCPPLDDLLSGCLRQIQVRVLLCALRAQPLTQEHARRIAKVTNECKLPLEVEKYVDKFKPSMMGIVLAWCNGASFVDVCKIADIFEGVWVCARIHGLHVLCPGSIIRTMRRLEELLREMRNAAHAIGNTQLKEKFDEARTRMKRDIVFAASLYL